MQSESVQVQELAEQVTHDCSSELLDALGVARVEPSPGVPEETQWVCAVVGFSGDRLRGSVLLACSQLAGVCLTGCIPGTLRDVMSELGNQLTGRIKNKFLRYGIDLFMTLPVILQGECMAPIPRIPITPLRFSLQSGSIWVWVDAECLEGFQSTFYASASKAPMSEGDTILF